MTGSITALLASPYPPPFIHLHHPHHPPSLVLAGPSDVPPQRLYARLDAIEHYTPRLLYSGILARLRTSARSTHVGSEGTDGTDGREVATWDEFVRGFRDLWARRDEHGDDNGNGGDPIARKGKTKATDHRKPTANGHGQHNAEDGEGRDIGADGVEGEKARQIESVVLVITKAERLRTVLGSGWAVVTRLAELSGAPVCVILVSHMPWDELRPARGDALEPIHVYLPPPTRDDILAQLLPCSEHPLWPRFLELLLATVYPRIVSPLPTLFHLAEALWPLYTSSLPPHAEMHLLGHTLPRDRDRDTDRDTARDTDPDPEVAPAGEGAQTPAPPPPPPPPPLEVTLKLLTDLKHHISLPLSAAVETLVPLQLGAHEFTTALLPAPASSAATGDGTRSRNDQGPGHGHGQRKTAAHLPKPPPLELGTAAKFLVVAAYCASYNPAKSDLRLFGRSLGVDGKRRRGGGMRRAGYGRVRIGKVPQRLLGPKPFPLDRLLALFASLYAEHAARPPDLAATLSDSGADLVHSRSGSDSESGSESDTATTTATALAFVPRARAAGAAKGEKDRYSAARRADRKRRRGAERDDAWEDQVQHVTMSVKLWSSVPELEAMGLLRRLSPHDRLDAVVLRCEAEHEATKAIARELGIVLDEYLYEATA